jgi:hypothetical protein
MGFFKKLMFWKKDDDFDFDKLADQGVAKPDDLGLNQPTGLEEKSPFDTPEFKQPQTPTLSPPVEQEQPSLQQTPARQLNDMDLVNSKLDTIKAILTSLDQRLANIERSSHQQQEKQKLW